MDDAMRHVTLLRLPRRASRLTRVTQVLTLPAIATLAIPGGDVPLLGGGVALVALIGILAWLAARAVSEPGKRLGVALTTSLAVALLAPVPVSLLVPALLGIAWLRRARPPVAANDNAATHRAPAFSWVPVERHHDSAPLQTLG